MKKYFPVLLFGLYVFGCTLRTNSDYNTETHSSQKRLPKIHLEEKEYDFGTIKDGDTVVHDFKFTNLGDDSLRIIEVSSSCGCTIPTWPNQPVAIGGSDKISVIFTKKNDPGDHPRLVIIKANTNPEYTTIKIKVKVLPPSH